MLQGSENWKLLQKAKMTGLERTREDWMGLDGTRHEFAQRILKIRRAFVFEQLPEGVIKGVISKAVAKPGHLFS